MRRPFRSAMARLKPCPDQIGSLVLTAIQMSKLQGQV